MAQTIHSKVYLVKHKQLGVYRVAKVVTGSSKECERALKEADIIKNFKHPGLPLVYDVKISGDSICIIEEYIDGKCLSEYIMQDKVNVYTVASIGVSICQVLEYLHENQGVVHMDIKPANIIVRKKSTRFPNRKSKKWKDMYDISIIDFDSSGFNNSVQEKMFGTVGYAAPEQYKTGNVNLDVQADIYSMGMLLLYMLDEKHMQSHTDDAEVLCQMYSDSIGPVIKRCIRHNPVQRYESIKELKRELQRIADVNVGKCLEDNTHEVKDIYVYGTDHLVGTTHFCLCLSAFLGRFYKRKKILCVEHSGSDDLRDEAGKGNLNQEGAYQRKGIYIMPDYGEGVEWNMETFDVRVHDCGIKRPEAVLQYMADNERDAGAKVICVDVCGYRKKLYSENTMEDTFVNHISAKRFYELVKGNRSVKRYYRMPCMYQWYEVNKLFEEAIIEALGLEKQKRKKCFRA